MSLDVATLDVYLRPPDVMVLLIVILMKLDVVRSST